jgi:hypothetical protein
MNLKKFFISSFAGFVAYFMLGWVFYGKLFPELHPHSAETNMMYIALGCLFFAFMLGYILNHCCPKTNWMTGLTIGAIASAFSALSMLFFMYSNMPFDSTMFCKELIVSVVSGGLTGATIAFVNGKLTPTAA